MFIEASQLKYHFHRRDESGEVIGTVQALDGVDFSVKKGEFVAVLGHNGSGKSTLAKHINRLVKPQEGSLFINGMDAKQESLLWSIRQTTGMVFQNPDNQIVAGVVEEDVAFGPENLGLSSEEIIQRVEEALNEVGMIQYRKHSPNFLSGGQKQRIAIAGVIAMRPDCIVFDESTAMLDPDGRKEVLEAARHLNQMYGVTVLWITHFMEEAINADSVYVMNQGKVHRSGTPREVFSQVGELLELGLDVPQVTRLAYELREVGMDLPLAILSREELVAALCGEDV